MGRHRTQLRLKTKRNKLRRQLRICDWIVLTNPPKVAQPDIGPRSQSHFAFTETKSYCTLPVVFPVIRTRNVLGEFVEYLCDVMKSFGDGLPSSVSSVSQYSVGLWR